MDWESLERRDFGSDNKTSFKVPVKKVAVSKDKVRHLSDGTVIVVDSDKSDLSDYSHHYTDE